MCVSQNTACTPFLGALLTINPQRAHTLEVVTASSEQEQQAQSSGNINDSPGEDWLAHSVATAKYPYHRRARALVRCFKSNEVQVVVL